MNNNVENLAWGTHLQNLKDKRRHGTNGTKLTESDVASIRRLRGAKTLSEVGEMFGVHLSTVGKILNNKLWSIEDDRQAEV